MNLCPTCRKLLYRTDPCKGGGIECGRTDGGPKFDRGPFPRVDIEAGPDLKISYVAKRKIPKAERLAVVKEVAQKLADQGEVVTVVDKIKRPRGRPAKITNMAEYKKQKQREYRERRAKEKST
jgi:hypothetical protein